MKSKTTFPFVTNKYVPLVAVAVIFAALVVFLNYFTAFDEGLLSFAQDLPRSLVGPALFVSFLGSTPFVCAVAVLGSIAEWIARRHDRAVVLAGSLMAMPLYQVIKLAVHRARPVTEFIERAGLHGDSFPSGHSAGSFAVYVTLAFLLLRELPRRWSRPAAGALITLTIFIGLSRVYLGAHFPTDVLGGWLLGGLVILGLRTGINIYQARKQPRQPV